MSARRLTDREKWSAPHADDFWGIVKHRINCETGGSRNPYKCGQWATWMVDGWKLCKRHKDKPVDNPSEEDVT